MHRRHPPDCFTRTQESADDVDGEDARQPLGSHRVDSHLRLEDARVVDERRQRSELSIRFGEQPLDVGL